MASEKKRKPWWLKLIISLVSIVLSVALIIVGVGVFLKVKYDVNVINVIKEIKTLQQEVKEDELFSNKFSDADMLSAQTAANAKSSNLITGDAVSGYKIGETAGTLSGDLLLTDKQIGAILTSITSEEDLSIDISGNKLGMEIIQIKFDKVETGKADVNVVFKIDISSLKEGMTSFPFSLINKYIPKVIYISSTVTVVKQEGAFSYNVESSGITINNLTKDETEDLIKSINAFAGIGAADEFNLQFGVAIVNAIIGNADHTEAFAYSLRDIGATDYNFVSVDNTNYFVIKK